MTPAEVEANSRGCHSDALAVLRWRLLENRLEDACHGWDIAEYQKTLAELRAHEAAHPWLFDI